MIEYALRPICIDEKLQKIFGAIVADGEMLVVLGRVRSLLLQPRLLRFEYWPLRMSKKNG